MHVTVTNFSLAKNNLRTFIDLPVGQAFRFADSDAAELKYYLKTNSNTYMCVGGDSYAHSMFGQVTATSDELCGEVIRMNITSVSLTFVDVD